MASEGKAGGEVGVGPSLSLRGACSVVGEQTTVPNILLINFAGKEEDSKIEGKSRLEGSPQTPSPD